MGEKLVNKCWSLALKYERQVQSCSSRVKQLHDHASLPQRSKTNISMAILEVTITQSMTDHEGLKPSSCRWWALTDLGVLVTVGRLALDSARDAERAVQSVVVQPRGINTEERLHGRRGLVRA